LFYLHESLSHNFNVVSDEVDL